MFLITVAIWHSKYLRNKYDIYVVELKQIYEAYKVYLHGLIYNDEISRINKNNNIEIEILDDYELIKI